MSAPLGQCLHCDGQGPVGAPCVTPPCARRGFAYVPLAFVPAGPQLADGLLGARFEDWLLVDLIGSGGFGRVYLALQLPIMLRAALKLLTRMEPRFLEKFHGEAAALAQLSHPNIVRLLKFGHARKLPYLVMEYVEGESLSSALDDPRSVVHQLDVAAHIVRQVANALDAAHAAGIVHRDIKPGNVLLQALPGDPAFVRVLDFGIAKFISETSDTSVAMGTPIYMAPETITRTNIGPWTDFYALGVMAFELLFGMPPWAGDVAEGLITGALTSVPDPLVGRRRLLPVPALAFFERALARVPEHRLRTAPDFRAAWSAAVDALRGLSPEAWRELRPAMRPEDVGPASDTHEDMAPLGAAVFPAQPPRTRAARPLVRAWAVAGALALGGGVALAMAIGGAARTPEPTTAPATPARDADADGDAVSGMADATGATTPGLAGDGLAGPTADAAEAPGDAPADAPLAAPTDATTAATIAAAPDVTTAPAATDTTSASALDAAPRHGPSRAADALVTTTPDAEPEATPPASAEPDAGPTPARSDASLDYIFVE